jgi:hypothetical protein
MIGGINEGKSSVARDCPIFETNQRQVDPYHQGQYHSSKIASVLLPPIQAKVRLIKINLAYVVGFLRQVHIEFFRD